MRIQQSCISLVVLGLCACGLSACHPAGHGTAAAATAPALTAAPAASAVAVPQPAAGSVPYWARGKNGAVIPPHDEHATPATPPPPGLYVAMGDSITHGTGATQACGAFPTHPVDIEEYCPDGTSYAIRVAKALRQAGVAGHFMNLGIGGAKLDRVINEEIPYLPAEATLVTLYIGTNDSRAVRDPKVPVAEVVKTYEERYERVLAMIHARAPRARVVLVNFPNQKYLAATYHVLPDVLPRYDATSQILDRFIDSHYPRYAVVDTICNPASYEEKLLWQGGVHPNNEGMALLAESVIKVVLAERPPAPPASCQWYDAGTAAHLAGQ